jgi:uncharacterized protein
MPSPLLDAVEARILGCLLEKERLTPENYPLSLNSLTSACNQSTNREPVTSFEERTVEAGLYSLREKKLASLIHAAGARVQKYRHNLPDQYELTPGETALLCVLLLRGPQTSGELRMRTERMYRFGAIDEVEGALQTLGKGTEPLVKMLPIRPGQKEVRYAQLLAAEAAIEPAAAHAGAAHAASATAPPGARVEALAEEVAALAAELRQLRDEFSAFRKQFES